MAYVAAETHRPDIESVATLRQSAQTEFCPYFVNNEVATRDWLRYYQAHPNHTPPPSQG